MTASSSVTISFARIFAAICLLWSLIWATIGATASGKAWYTQLASRLSFSDTKGGIPIIVLAAPMLLAACVIYLIATRAPEVQQRSSITRTSQILRRLPCQQRLLSGGDVNYTKASLIIIIPCFSYALCSTYRHLQGIDWSDLNERLMDAANAQGMAALIASCFLMVPVARGSAILRLMHWNPACAIQLHIWIGRCVMLCSLLHGGMHMMRWKWTLLGEDWTTLLVPPAPCWTMRSDSEFMPTCRNPETDCTCYHLFRNLTGAIAGVGLVVIFVSSCNTIRRRFYSIFYKIHILAGPLVLIMIILHYNRAILYMAGGLLLYVASSFPVLVESQWRRRQQPGVKILSVHTIPGEENMQRRSCVSLTVEASDSAMAQYRAGQYVRLAIPEVSTKAHPFSVNIVPNVDNQLRVIFRVVGPFTLSLANHLRTSAKPILHLDGFFGSDNRVAQALRHDSIVIVAGGIGITSYLSLLYRLQYVVSSSKRRRFPLRQIVLHWMCRDASLIDHVTREYWEHLQDLPACHYLTIRIVIHHTRAVNVSAGNALKLVQSSFSDVENPQDDSRASNGDGDIIERAPLELASGGVPFTPLQFTPVSATRHRHNVLPFTAFTVIAGLGLICIWSFYTNVQSDDAIITRFWAPVLVVVLALAVAVAANFVGQRLSLDDDPSAASAEWTSVSTSADESLELSKMGSEVVSDVTDNVDAVMRVTTAGEPSVSLEEILGRPSLHSFLNILDDARQPGVFACGPSSLMEQVRVVVGDRCAARLRQCIKGGAQIALYEESFQT
ncbi:hypothetical protein MPSEU_000941200 [Mayamaea pseudoterrestris]|nr:hypothetical protein MPSEU_000941200 [Mayamaea pseudoterrestris]